MKEKLPIGDNMQRLLVDEHKEHKWERYVNKNKMNTVDRTKLLEKLDAACNSRSDTK